MSDTSSARNRALLIGAAVALVPNLLRFVAGSNQVIGMIVGCVVCLALIGSGTVAVQQYTSATRSTLPAGEGAKMGFQVGLIVMVVSTALMLVMWLFAGMPSMADYMIEQAQRSQPDMPPEQLEAMETMFSNPGILVAMLVGGTVVSLVAPVLGGLLGATIFKKGGELPAQQSY
ncbi:MAG: MptD family putative ECF transporter S component [Bacteroidetes bacterium]|nr:MptD family putative ECF transporter S component [Bacteroidota bacterium]